MITRTKEIIGASARIYFSQMRMNSNMDYGPGYPGSYEMNQSEYKFASSYQDKTAREAGIPSGLQKAIEIAADITPAAIVFGSVIGFAIFNSKK